LPEVYAMEYLVFSSAKTVADEEMVWDLDFIDLIKRAMFRKYDAFLGSKARETKT